MESLNVGSCNLQSYYGRTQVPLKGRYLPTKLHGVTSQKPVVVLCSEHWEPQIRFKPSSLA